MAVIAVHTASFANFDNRTKQKEQVYSTMIEHLLQSQVCERFKNDPHYRDGHLRVINALPNRRVMGLHAPEMKQTAKQISHNGCEIALPDGSHKSSNSGTEVIRHFEAAASDSLCYEETVIWGFLINLKKCTTAERLAMLERYVPVLDNWAVCDSYCANAKWMARADKELLWSFLERYFKSEREFEVRFAIVTAMTYFLNMEWLERVFEQLNDIDFDGIKSDYVTAKGKPETAQQGTVPGAVPYYVRMGVAWLLATALAKFPIPTREFARSSHLPADVIKLYTRKARESLRTRNEVAL